MDVGVCRIQVHHWSREQVHFCGFESLAATFGLNKARHFTLSCRDLILAVDHKPLLGILGNKSLDCIENPRLLNFKEKTLRYDFKVVHIPGVLHKGADALSRHPEGGSDHLRCEISITPT